MYSLNRVCNVACPAVSCSIDTTCSFQARSGSNGLECGKRHLVRLLRFPVFHISLNLMLVDVGHNFVKVLGSVNLLPRGLRTFPVVLVSFISEDRALRR